MNNGKSLGIKIVSRIKLTQNHRPTQFIIKSSRAVHIYIYSNYGCSVISKIVNLVYNIFIVVLGMVYNIYSHGAINNRKLVVIKELILVLHINFVIFGTILTIAATDCP